MQAAPTLSAVPSTLGGRLRWARKRLGLSHDKVAVRAGTSRQHLIALEKGRHTPTEAMLLRLADALDLPVEFFVGDVEERLAAEQRDRLANALHPFVDELATELVDLVHKAMEAHR
jgi:transcriptional regulator with XRE-family HTH domain